MSDIFVIIQPIFQNAQCNQGYHVKNVLAVVLKNDITVRHVAKLMMIDCCDHAD